MVFNFVLGTAAELIKVYPVIRGAQAAGHPVCVLATGQSRENFLMQYRDFGLDESLLAWLLPSQGDLETSGSALRWFFRAYRASGRRAARGRLLPGPVIVHGDTLSTFIGARLGHNLGYKVVHIEAGLRSGRLFNPFPEELTRRLVSRWARVHMAPDATAEGNLKRAGVHGEVVCTFGNTLMDAVRGVGGAGSGDIASVGGKPYAVANIHRYENLNHEARWLKIVNTLVSACRRGPVVMVLHPQTRHRLHTDPEARERLEKAGVEMRERMPFSQFIALLKGAEYLISDGGSNQEECSYLGKPCLLLRLETERLEGLDGCCVLSRFDDAVIEGFLADPLRFQGAEVSRDSSPTEIILNQLTDHSSPAARRPSISL